MAERQLSPKTMLIILLLSLLCFLTGMKLPERFSITISDSLRYSLFFLTGFDADSRVKKGDYVMFHLKNRPEVQEFVSETFREHGEAARHMNNRPVYFIKEVVCIQGDYFRNDGADYYCNEKYLGRAKQLSSAGRLLNRFHFDGIVPEGHFAAWGHSEDSFDSRYFGFITIKEVVSTAWPLW